MSNVYPNAVPYAVLVKSIAPAGKSTDELAPFELGVLNPETFKTVSDSSMLDSLRVAVGSPNNPATSVSRAGLIDKYNRKVSMKSMELSRVNKKSFYINAPKDATGFVGYYGFNGLSTSKSIEFKTGETKEFEVQVYGDIVKRLYGQYEVFERFAVSVPALEAENCGEVPCPEVADCGLYTEKLVEKMNDLRMGHNKVARFGKFSVVKECTTTPAKETVTATTFHLTICDNGDNEALAFIKSKVEAQYRELVHRIKRAGSMSTYEVCITGTTPPTALTTLPNVDLAVCETCPSGYTLTPTKYVHKVQRVVNPTMTPAENKEAFVASYVAEDSIVVATSGVSTEDNTVTAAGFADLSVGDTVVYYSNGGTALAPLVNGTTYFVKTKTSTAITLSATETGNAIDLTGTGNNNQAFYPGSFVVSNTTTEGSTNIYSVQSDSPTFEVLESDVLLSTVEYPAVCVSSTATVNWTSDKTYYKLKRDMILHVSKGECDTEDQVFLDQVEEVFGNLLDNITISETKDCVISFTGTQTSPDCLATDCDTNDDTLATFPHLPSFKGNNWEVYNASETVHSGCKCGIKVVSNPINCELGGCGYDPNEYAESDVPMFRIYEINPIDLTEIKPSEDTLWFEAQRPSQKMLDGHRVLEDILLYRAYRGELYFSPSMAFSEKFKAAEGNVYGIQPCNKYYVVHIMGDYGESTSLSASFGDKLTDLRLYFESRAVMEQAVEALSGFAAKFQVYPKWLK